MESRFLLPLPPNQTELYTQVTPYRRESSPTYDKWRAEADTALFWQRKMIEKIDKSCCITFHYGMTADYPDKYALTQYDKPLMHYLKSRKLVLDSEEHLVVHRFLVYTIDPGMIEVFIKEKHPQVYC